MKKDDVKAGNYYKLRNENTNESCIVYAYRSEDLKLYDGVTDNPNFCKLGFGFNTADGGGWMPLWDVSEKSEITEVSFTDNKKITTIKDIDTETETGKCLLASISKITTESQLTKTPDEVLIQINRLVQEMFRYRK